MKTEIIKEKKPFVKSIMKGSLLALSISLILVCVFAFLLRFINIPISAIKPVNQAIKIISVLVGVMFALKKCRELGLVMGFAIGILFNAFAFVIFSLLNGGFVFEPSIINDLLFGGITGGIAGIFTVNFTKK